jgi:hypothetical protein
MRYLLYSLLASAIVGGALAATQTTTTEPETKRVTSQQKKTPKDYEQEMEDFEPSEKVPADSAISFPVDI